MANSIDKPVCKVPSCGRPTPTKGANSRGLCGPCYAQARRMVKLNQTSWHELEVLGLADAPIRKVVPREKLPLEVALLAARANQNKPAQQPAGAERFYTYQTEVRNHDGKIIHQPGDTVYQVVDEHGYWRDGLRDGCKLGIDDLARQLCPDDRIDRSGQPSHNPQPTVGA